MLGKLEDSGMKCWTCVCSGAILSNRRLFFWSISIYVTHLCLVKDQWATAGGKALLSVSVYNKLKYSVCMISLQRPWMCVSFQISQVWDPLVYLAAFPLLHLPVSQEPECGYKLPLLLSSTLPSISLTAAGEVQSESLTMLSQDKCWLWRLMFFKMPLRPPTLQWCYIVVGYLQIGSSTIPPVTNFCFFSTVA